MKVDYEKIYAFLATKSGKVVSACGIAYGIGVDRIYGGTMAKLVRDGALEPMPEKGFYRSLVD